jgi:hypothetical protein
LDHTDLYLPLVEEGSSSCKEHFGTLKDSKTGLPVSIPEFNCHLLNLRVTQSLSEKGQMPLLTTTADGTGTLKMRSSLLRTPGEEQHLRNFVL